MVFWLIDVGYTCLYLLHFSPLETPDPLESPYSTIHVAQLILEYVLYCRNLV